MSGTASVRRWAARPGVVDAAVAIGVLVADVVAQIGVAAGSDWPSPSLGAGAVVVAIAAAAPLLWRRRRPWLCALGLVIGAIVAAAAVPPGLFTQQCGATVALGVYAIAAWSAQRRMAVLVPALALAAVIAGAIGDGTATVEALLGAIAIVALPWAVGYAARSRRLYLAEVEQRLATAERDRDTLAHQAVAEERTRIARELHDVVAHHVSLIGVQAGAARLTLPTGAASDTARASLTAIETSSRAAVNEMRRLLGVLRADGSGAEVAPAPGLARLDDLVDEFRAAGIDVRSSVEADVAGLDPTLDVCCYRVVEEALTNIARHSAARTATVSVRADDVMVRILVADPGPARLPPPGPPRAGRGLVGMTERAALFAGRVAAGRQPDGGFAVMAELPRTQPA